LSAVYLDKGSGTIKYVRQVYESDS
jgi:hypothetical protein